MGWKVDEEVFIEQSRQAADGCCNYSNQYARIILVLLEATGRCPSSVCVTEADART